MWEWKILHNEEILELYPFQVLLGIQIKKAEMAGACDIYG